MLHRLGPASSPFGRLAVIHNFRLRDAGPLTLADLLDETALQRLRSGVPAVRWQVSGSGEAARLLARWNIACGVSFPFHNACGAHVALTFCDAEVNIPPALGERLRLAAQDFAAAMLAQTPSPSPGLSAREKACLQWAAAGKTAEETAIILGLSQHTASQHMTAAMLKLGAANKPHAVAKAIRLGLVDLSLI